MRKALAILFMTVGVFGSFMVWQSGHTYLALVASALTVYVAYVFWVEVVKTSSWHYRLAARYFKSELEGICKACPYWAMVFAAMIIGVLDVIVTVLYNVVLNVGHLPLVAAGWAFGSKPRYWYPSQKLVGENKRSYFLQERDMDKRYSRRYERSYRTKWWKFPFWYVAIGFGLALIFTGTVMFQPVSQLGWYWVWPAAYGTLIALVLIRRQTMAPNQLRAP